jgi:ankyrin repeat protein
MVKLLLKSKKCTVDAQDSRGATPLLWATVTNKPESVQALLVGGAKALLGDNSGKTPLQYALQLNYTVCAELLKQYSASTHRLHSHHDVVAWSHRATGSPLWRAIPPGP